MRDIVFGILLVFLGRTSHMVARAQTTPSSCSAGSWLDSYGSCQACYAGMYSASGAYACSYCAVGSYSSGYRSSSCSGIYVTITSLEPTYVPPYLAFYHAHTPMQPLLFVCVDDCGTIRSLQHRDVCSVPWVLSLFCNECCFELCVQWL